MKFKVNSPFLKIQKIDGENVILKLGDVAEVEDFYFRDILKYATNAVPNLISKAIKSGKLKGYPKNLTDLTRLELAHSQTNIENKSTISLELQSGEALRDLVDKANEEANNDTPESVKVFLKKKKENK